MMGDDSVPADLPGTQKDPQAWGCLADSSEVYQLNLPSRDAALDALDGEPGVVLRYERGFPREGLEFFFEVATLLAHVDEHAAGGGQVIADFESGIFVDTTPEEANELRRRLADTLHDWIQKVNPRSYVVVETKDIEAVTNAKNATP